MAGVKKKHLQLLEPYLVGERAREDGEWDMFCPLHEDTNRSAQMNVLTGEWFCHACQVGGRVAELIRQQSEWIPPNRAKRNGHARGKSSSQAMEVITEAKIRKWIDALHADEYLVEQIVSRRGLEVDTIRDYEIGWDAERHCYTLPVRDEEGEIWNVRRYQFDPPQGRRKMWGVTGMNVPRLYPMSVFDDDPQEIVICEGEWDALLTNQQGIPAVTRTASAGTWDAEWGEHFRGRTVYVCHDRDNAGRSANEKVRRMLERVADVKVVELPYKLRKDHGKDLTDYWLEGHDVEDFKRLVDRVAEADSEVVEDLDPSDSTVLDSFDARRVGKPLRLTVTIKGKKDPGYSVPRRASLTCTRDAGAKCQVCPMNAASGSADFEVEAHDPVVLELMESTKQQVHEVIRREFGAMKCSKLSIDPLEYQSVEILFARPSVEHTNGSSGAYKNIKLTSVGRHDTQANNTVRVEGALHPDPRKQLNEFLAWEVSPLASSLDHFDVHSSDLSSLRKFQCRRNQRPLRKLGDISRDLAAHVTRIYGRPELHAAMDLVFHSVTAFDFAGQRVERGWVELLVVGDTRTGKSEAATQLTRHYHAGEIVSCESASFAGIVGGLQQYGSGKEWAINWGAIPLNDRRLVVLDEISGLTPESIASMSDVRSRGVAQLTKVQTEATLARTRLIWLGNPRDASMADFTYGVQALRPLIGNPEDIARFDIAMSVSAGEVSPDEINKDHSESEDQKYDSESCSALVRWVWSRRPDQVVWAKGAESAVYDAARALGQRYVEDPPLVQAANVRIKVARLAVALAARLFSTDESCEHIIVRPEHVEDAVAFLDRVYSMRGFGYQELSQERLDDIQEAKQKAEDVKYWLIGRKGLPKFLRSNPSFRRQDLEEVLNVSREEANAIISTLYDARMVKKTRGDVRVEPSLHTLLREVKE